VEGVGVDGVQPGPAGSEGLGGGEDHRGESESCR
jgi:hypothetical protein